MLQVLPVVVFFSSVISALYYFGIMQLVVARIAWFLQVKTSQISPYSYRSCQLLRVHFTVGDDEDGVHRVYYCG